MNNELKIDEIYPNSIFIDNEPTRHELFEKVMKLQQENQQLHNKIDKAIEYLINPPKKIWEGHSIDEVVRILKESDVDECELEKSFIMG